MNDEMRELGLAVLDFLRTEYPGGIGYDEEDEAAYRLCHAAEIDFTFHRYAEHQKPAALIEGYRRCICCGYEVRVAYVNRCATCKEACDQPYEPALYQHSMGPRGGRPGGDGTISDGPTDDPTGGWLHAAEMTVHDAAISALADKRVTFYRVGDGDAIAVYIEDDQRRLPTIAEAAIMRDAAFELPDVLAEVKRLRERSAVLDAGKYEELVAKRVLRRGHRATRTRRGAAVPRPPSSGARGGSGTWWIPTS